MLLYVTVALQLNPIAVNSGNHVKEVNFHKPTGMNSLSIRFALLVFMLTVVASAAIAYAVLMLQQNVLIEQEKQQLKRQSEKYARELDAGFLTREKKAISANNIVVRYLTKATVAAAPPPAMQADGSVRSQDDLSAAFIPHAKLDAQQAAWLVQTEELWQQLAPLMLEELFNFYYISFLFSAGVPIVILKQPAHFSTLLLSRTTIPSATK